MDRCYDGERAVGGESGFQLNSIDSTSRPNALTAGTGRGPRPCVDRRCSSGGGEWAGRRRGSVVGWLVNWPGLAEWAPRTRTRSTIVRCTSITGKLRTIVNRLIKFIDGAWLCIFRPRRCRRPSPAARPDGRVPRQSGPHLQCRAAGGQAGPGTLERGIKRGR